jgi:hypothetical protein
MGCSIWSRRSDVVHPGRADGPVGDTEAVTLFEQTIAFADAFREEFLAQVRRQADVAFQAIIGSRPLAEDGRSLLEQLDGIMKESSLNKCAQEAIAMRLHDWVQGVTLVRDQPEWATYVDTLGTSLFVAILEPLAYQPLKERQEKEVSKAETALATIDGDMDRAKKALNAVSEKPRQEAQRLTQERDRQAALLTQSAEAIRLLHEQQCKLATVPQTGSNRTLQTQLAERLQHEEREHHKLQAALVDLDRLLQTVLERLAQRIEPLNAKLNELSQQRVLVAGELEEKKATLAEMNRCCSVVNPISTEDHANWLITHGILSQTQADHLRALSNQLIARDVLGAIAQSAELIRSFLPTPQRPP